MSRATMRPPAPLFPTDLSKELEERERQIAAIFESTNVSLAVRCLRDWQSQGFVPDWTSHLEMLDHLLDLSLSGCELPWEVRPYDARASVVENPHGTQI